jgi:hypothetical protein
VLNQILSSGVFQEKNPSFGPADTQINESNEKKSNKESTEALNEDGSCENKLNESSEIVPNEITFNDLADESLLNEDCVEDLD